jgi:hypothetical protein
VFENRVLRRIFGPKRVEITGGWRKLRNEELRDLYSSPSIIRMMKPRKMRWVGHVARIGRRIHVGSWWNSHGKGPHGRPRHTWVNNVKIADWFGSGYGQVESSCQSVTELSRSVMHVGYVYRPA